MKVLEFQSLANFAQAADLIRRSWKENKETTLDYNQEFLASCYEYPGTELEFSPALYENGELIAFVSGFPRRVRLDGESLRLLLLTFFTVAPERKGQGLGRAVWAECLVRARSAGFDGAIHYCVDGNKSNEVTVAAASSVGLQSQRVFTVNYLMKFVRPGRPCDPIKSDAPGLPQTFLQAAELLQPRLRFARVWSLNEATWECQERYGAITAVHIGPASGLLTGYVLNVADSTRTPCLFIEDVLWDELTDMQRSELLEQLLGRAASRAQVAVVPLWGYSDPGPFLKAGFRASTRRLHAYLTLWSIRSVPDSLGPMYIDVF